MIDRFFFYGPEKVITGIDENGYGPLIGPLIITGVQIKASFDSIYSLKRELLRFDKLIQDSKKIFRRTPKSYATGEGIALSLLRHAGKNTDDFFSLISSISSYEISDLVNFKIPVWDQKAEHDYFPKTIEFEIKDIYIEVIDATLFNKQIERYDNKAYIDFLGFKKVREHLESDIYLMGKIGGTKYYGDFFFVSGDRVTALIEERHISLYTYNGRELYFLLNGDEQYLPVMLSGIVGKYVRELFMKSISELFGFKDIIPFASGYHHDPKTKMLKEQILKEKKAKRFIRIR